MTKNRTTIITGASGGIGAEMAKTYLAHGHNVVLTGRDAEKLHGVAEKLGATDRIALVVGDLREATIPQKIIDSAVSRFGPTLCNLINNAGEFLVKPFLETKADDLTPFLDMFKGTYVLTKLAAQQMIEQSGNGQIIEEDTGCIVFISTIFTQGFIQQFPCSAVGSVKAAFSGFARNACHELAAHNIRVNTLDLGVIETPIYGMNEDELSTLRAFQPLNRNGTASEVADMVHFISEQARFVTGQVLTMDGGVTAGHFAL